MQTNGRFAQRMAQRSRTSRQALERKLEPGTKVITDDGSAEEMTGMPTPPSHVIELSQVTKVYGEGEGEVHALRGIDLAIAPGEFVAVMGPSGSGKSTCMNILGCLDTPTSATIAFSACRSAR